MLRGLLICVGGSTPESEDEGVVFGELKNGELLTLNPDTLNCSR